MHQHDSANQKEPLTDRQVKDPRFQDLRFQDLRFFALILNGWFKEFVSSRFEDFDRSWFLTTTFLSSNFPAAIHHVCPALLSSPESWLSRPPGSLLSSPLLLCAFTATCSWICPQVRLRRRPDYPPHSSGWWVTLARAAASFCSSSAMCSPLRCTRRHGGSSALPPNDATSTGRLFAEFGAHSKHSRQINRRRRIWCRSIRRWAKSAQTPVSVYENHKDEQMWCGNSALCTESYLD